MHPAKKTRGLQSRRRAAELIALSFALVLIVASLISLAAFSMELLSAVRAYVNGEALWSKNQKEAVLRLVRYARSHSDADYDGFLDALQVPLGDRAARVELSKRGTFDRNAAAQGFLAGANHREDVSRLIWLFRNFGRFSYMKKAIGIWEQGDLLIGGLAAEGMELHKDVSAGTLSGEKADRAVEEVYRINAQLTPLENSFSQTLGEAARRIQWMLLSLMAAGGALLIIGGVVTCGSLLRRVQESESKYHHLLDTASEAILVADARTSRVLEVNLRCETMVGMPARELLGAFQPLLPSGGPLVGFWESFVEGVRGDDGTYHEMRLRRGDGTILPVEVSANLAHIDGRMLVQMIVRDLTARKQAEDELRSARDHAIDASRVKGQFLANMSHEIRTPLNGVLGMISVLLATELDEEQHEYARVAKDSAESLLHVINDILDFSRIEAGRLEIQTAPFDPRSLVAKVIEMLRDAAEKKAVKIESSIDPALPATILGDEARLRQILTNLVTNAAKFTDRGSVRVEVRLLRDSAGWERVRFEVEDTGIGIPPAAQSKLFEAFSQADGSISRRYGGTGLGLAISRQLVGLMDGEIGVRSEPGSGSTFWFWVPLDSPEDERPVPAGRETGGA